MLGIPDASTTTTEIWIDRVDAWRASGERAEDFSKRAGYAASTLRWWASKLKRDLAAPTPARSSPEIRLAKVLRAERPAGPVSETRSGSGIVLDVTFAGVRIDIAPGSDRKTLAMVLELLGVGVDR